MADATYIIGGTAINFNHSYNNVACTDSNPLMTITNIPIQPLTYSLEYEVTSGNWSNVPFVAADMKLFSDSADTTCVTTAVATTGFTL